MTTSFFLTRWLYLAMSWVYEQISGLFGSSAAASGHGGVVVVLTIFIFTLAIRLATSVGDISSRKSSIKMQSIQPELDRIQKKYKDPDLDVHELAEEMGMNRSALNERIQSALGLTTAQFIRTYRLNVAKEMICNGTNKSMNVSEIAYEVGFNDPKYFTRCFTKEFGATPSELQKLNS